VKVDLKTIDYRQYGWKGSYGDQDRNTWVQLQPSSRCSILDLG